MQILALNSYHGGSHKAFLDQWLAHSRHQWTVLSLPPHHWKWRMRHAGVYFAEQLASCDTDAYDLLWCTDMLNLAEFIGLAPQAIQTLPRVIYFHENQLGYPDQYATEKDLHYAFSNFTSALAATEVWFNSGWHLESFYALTRQWLARMPDFQPVQAIQTAAAKSRVQPPGIIHPGREARTRDQNRPLTLAWVARWEDDKNPAAFFEALMELKRHGINFRLNMLGANPARTSPLFKQARQALASHIDQWGYVNDRTHYLDRLSDCDLVVSTAAHEFFGIAVLEAVACGCIPLVPDRLAYPETLSLYAEHHPECFYDGSVGDLVKRLIGFAEQANDGDFASGYRRAATATRDRFQWPQRAAHMDDRLQALCRQPVKAE